MTGSHVTQTEDKRELLMLLPSPPKWGLQAHAAHAWFMWHSGLARQVLCELNYAPSHSKD